jgi:hypothetical protein
MIDNAPLESQPGRLDTLQSVLDAIPTPVFLIDKQARIEMLNKSAREQRNLLHAYTHRERMGNVMGCINAMSSSSGCGGARNCADCPIRKGVADAITGTNALRKNVVFQLLVDGEYVPIHMWMTASGLRYDRRTFVVLILEDVAELIQKTELIPLCKNCGKTAGDPESSQSVHAYVQKRFESERSRTLCSDCQSHSV